MLKKSLIILALIIMLIPALARGQEGDHVLGTQSQVPEDRSGRTFLKCTENFFRFLYIGTRFSDIPSHISLRFPPFLRDFFLMPSHYADVMNIEQQLNRARNAVMAAAFRCDVQRQRSAERAYYKLEAELYYVRYYVDPGPILHGSTIMKAIGTVSGRRTQLKRVTDDPSRRQKFLKEMIDAFGAIPALTDDERESLLTSYFEEFEQKYADRPNTYANPDALWEELANKIDELIDTFKSFKNLGSEMKELGRETAQYVGEGVQAVREKAVSFAKSPGKVLGEGVKAIHDIFQICSKDDTRECKPYYEAIIDTVQSVLGVGSSVQRFSEKKTYEDVQVAVQTRKEQQTADTEEAEMRARYEALYGAVTGDGISDIIDKLDELLAVITEGRRGQTPAETVEGTIPPMNAFYRCVKSTRSKECR